MLVHSHSAKKLKHAFVSEEAYTILRDWIVYGTLMPIQQLRNKRIGKTIRRK
jgi:hypothetical protein